jgi:ribosomal protein L37AE/L43A
MSFSRYFEGYTIEAEFCPFCGAEIGSHSADGTNDCNECGRRFAVIEDDQNEDN